jgi:hypothetical protein
MRTSVNSELSSTAEILRNIPSSLLVGKVNSVVTEERIRLCVRVFNSCRLNKRLIVHHNSSGVIRGRGANGHRDTQGGIKWRKVHCVHSLSGVGSRRKALSAPRGWKPLSVVCTLSDQI